MREGKAPGQRARGLESPSPSSPPPARPSACGWIAVFGEWGRENAPEHARHVFRGQNFAAVLMEPTRLPCYYVINKNQNRKKSELGPHTRKIQSGSVQNLQVSIFKIFSKSVPMFVNAFKNPPRWTTSLIWTTGLIWTTSLI